MKLLTDYIVIPKEGETESGDAVVIRQEEEYSMLAVVDALGHGPKAASVAAAFIEEIGAVALDIGVANIVEILHARLQKTRGAAAVICVTRGDSLEGCSVGNVALRSSRPHLPMMLTPGVLGARLQGLRVFRANLDLGDRLVVFSDGISSQMRVDELQGLSPRDACRSVMDRHRHAHDDATILVADVRSLE